MNLTNFRFIFITFLFIAACTVGYIQTTRLNSLALVSGLGIEKEEKEYIISLQVYNPEANKKEASNEIAGYTYTERGKTIPDAIQKLEKKVPKFIFIESLQIVALGENILREEGLDHLLDFLIRSPRIPANIQLVVIKNASPDVFFQLFTPIQELSSLSVSTLLKQSENRWGTLQDISAERVKSLLEDHTSDFVLPYIEMKGAIEQGISRRNIDQFKPPTSLMLSGLALFNKETLQAYFTFKESNLFALVRGVNQKVSITVPCSNNEEYLTFDTIQTKSKLISEINPVSFQFKIQIKGNLDEIACEKDLTKPEIVKEIEGFIEQKITKDLNELAENDDLSEADYLGLKDALYRQHPTFWAENKNNLEAKLSDPQVNVDVNVTMNKTGLLKKISH